MLIAVLGIQTNNISASYKHTTETVSAHLTALDTILKVPSHKGTLLITPTPDNNGKQMVLDPDYIESLATQAKQLEMKNHSINNQLRTEISLLQALQNDNLLTGIVIGATVSLGTIVVCNFLLKNK